MLALNLALALSRVCSGVTPYSIHTTFQYGGADGKRHRLREAMAWEDDPAYYDPPGGLLRYDADVPTALVHPVGGMTASAHVALVDYQLAQLGAAFALAFALGRKLVLPALVCGYDKAWFALDHGAFAGAPSWELPIRNCPLDHVLEPDQLHVYEFAREYSVLANPRTPAHVLASAATLDLRRNASVVEEDGSAAGTGGGERGGEGGEGGGEGSGDATMIARLRSEYADVKLLTIAGLPSLDSLYARRVLSRHVAQRLERQFHSVGGGWCCAPKEDVDRGMPTSHHFRLPLLPTSADGSPLNAWFDRLTALSSDGL